MWSPRPAFRRALQAAWTASALCLFGVWPTPHACAQVDEAHETALSEGVRAFANKEWKRARAAFVKAHGFRATARTWRALGLTGYELGLWADAVVELEQALSSQTRPLTQAQRKEVERVLETARSKVADVRLEGLGEADRVWLDDKPVVLRAGGRLLLSPGHHLLAAQDARGSRWRTQLLAEAGQTHRLQVTYEAAAPADEPQPATPLATPVTSSTQQADADTIPKPLPPAAKRAAWILTGLAVPTLIAALPLAIKASRENECQGECADDPKVRQSEREQYERLRRATNVTFFTGLGLAVGSSIAWARHARQRRVHVAVSRRQAMLRFSTAF